MIVASIMSDISTFFSVALFFVLLTAGLLVSLATQVLKRNDKLRDSVKQVAKEEGQEAVVKLIERMLTGRK